MKILFEDEQIIVCIKPEGILSQSDSKGGESMITQLEEYCGAKIYPLHRLDREVGGVMVYAKTQKAAAMISKDIAELGLTIVGILVVFVWCGVSYLISKFKRRKRVKKQRKMRGNENKFERNSKIQIN